MEGATTMSKELNKKLYYFSTFDGGLYLVGNSTNAKFIINMKKENLDFVEKIEDTLKEARIGFTRVDRKDYNTDGFNRKPQVRLESKNHPLLTKIFERIYIDGKKVIDPHMLTMLDAEALAIIFMADGSRVQDKRSPESKPNYTLNTKGFSYGDNWLLKKTIKDIFDIEFNINRQNNYWYLRLRAKDVEKFEQIVSPFILPSFSYKLGR
jgi:hypothetical protein